MSPGSEGKEGCPPGGERDRWEKKGYTIGETINFLLRVRDVGLFARQGREKRFYTR